MITEQRAGNPRAEHEKLRTEGRKQAELIAKLKKELGMAKVELENYIQAKREARHLLPQEQVPVSLVCAAQQSAGFFKHPAIHARTPSVVFVLKCQKLWSGGSSPS